jgi:Protein of unknown function DUF262
MDAVKTAENALRQQEKQIRFKIKPFRVADLVQKYENSQFYIPDYQREDVWTIAMKSKFIESVLLGLPIPDIFVCETKENDEDYGQIAKFEVIDGSQRLRTLAGFVSNKFRLTKLETVKALDGFHYSKLTDFRKDKFNDVTIDIIILHSETSEEVKNAMFDRINTSNPLKLMELRRGSYTGLFNNLVRFCGDLLKNDYQSICQINSYFKDRREEEELALRFFALSETFEDKLSFIDISGKRVSEFNEGNDDFLTSFYQMQNFRLKQLQENNLNAYEKEVTRLKTNFVTMLEFVKNNFKYGFKREQSKSVARVIFEAIAVGVHLALKQKPVLENQKKSTDWVRRDETFKTSISQKYGLHEANKIIERISIVRDKLLNSSR